LLEGQLTVPSHAKDVKIYVETEFKNSPSPQDLMDFYIDDFTATPANLPEIEKDIPSLKDVFAVISKWVVPQLWRNWRRSLQKSFSSSIITA